jgi:hypothetical protein
VRVGTFYYPARLIQKVNKGWRVKLWRGNIFPTSAAFVGGGVYTIDLTDIIDSLWRNRGQRRTVWVSASYLPALDHY